MKINSGIIVVFHKPYAFPKSDFFLPIHAGAATSSWKSGFLRDDTGENISQLNNRLNEFTALYCFWKNKLHNNYDIVGLCHYRRFFFYPKKWYKKAKTMPVPYSNVNSLQPAKDFLPQVHHLLNRYDVLVHPIMKLRNGKAKSTIEAQYGENHFLEDWNKLRQIIERIYPHQYDDFLRFEKLPYLIQCHMFLSRPPFIDAYMPWMMPLVEELIKIPQRENPNENRAIGFLIERLFHFYIFTHRMSYKEMPVIHVKES